MKEIKVLVFSLIALLVTSCNNDDDSISKVSVDFGTAPTSAIITTGTVNVITENEVRYHTIDFGTAPYTVTIVETQNAVVIIDLGPIPAFATELKTYVDAIGKPGAVIITHNHGDHYGGAGSFTNFTFYAESVVAGQLNNTAEPGGFAEQFSANTTVTAVNGTTKIGDLDFTFGKVSDAETGENGYVYNLKHKALFSGDLVYNLTHPYLREYTPKDTEDEIDNWVTGLNLLKTNFSDYNHLFVGHNGSRSDVGTAIDENIAYLQNAKGLIKGTKNLTSGGIATTNQEVIDELEVLYPTYKEGGLRLSGTDGFFPGDTGADWF